MTIRETRSHGCQTIKVRRLDTLGSLEPQIFIAEIIGQNQYDVRLFFCTLKWQDWDCGKASHNRDEQFVLHEIISALLGILTLPLAGESGSQAPLGRARDRHRGPSPAATASDAPASGRVISCAEMSNLFLSGS